MIVLAGLLACKGGSSGNEEELRKKVLELKERELKLREKQASEPAPGPAAVPTPEPSQTAAPPPAPSGPREVTVKVSLAVDITKPGGKPWDAAGDAADPVISAASSSGQSGNAAFQDNLNVNAQFKMKLSPGDTVMITAVDKDLAANDPIGTFSAKYTGPGSNGKGRNGAGSFTITFQ